MDTSKFFLPLLIGCGFAALLALFGFLLTVFGPIDHKNSKRYTVFAASLAAAMALWLVQRSHLVQNNSIFDMTVLLLILWFSCLFVFWLGVVQGIKLTGHHADFGESSILSMQYMESRMVETDQAHHATDMDFQPTELHDGGNPLLSPQETTRRH